MDTFLNRLRDRKLVNGDRMRLPNAVDTVDGLILRIWVEFKHLVRPDNECLLRAQGSTRGQR